MQRMKLNAIIFAASVTAVAVAAVMPNSVSAAQISTYDMDENPVPNSTVFETTNGGLNGRTSYNWNGGAVTGIAPNSSGAYYFRGWWVAATNSTDEVDETASSYTIPDNSDLNPDNRGFAISFYVQTRDPEHLYSEDPNSNSLLKSGDTLNIVQKGLAGPNRQQWKVSTNPQGKYICSFRGPSASGVITEYNVKSTIAYAHYVTHKVTCFLSSTHQITLTVDNNQYTTQGPAGGVRNDADVTVGKKPGSVNPGDTFSGKLDNLVITKF